MGPRNRVALVSKLTQSIEKRFTPRTQFSFAAKEVIRINSTPDRLALSERKEKGISLASGEKSTESGREIVVVVIGGGIAGSAFTRQLLLQSQGGGRRYKIFLVNSSNCNYCGGLITTLARTALEQVYGLPIPRELMLKQVDTCVYLNTYGSAEVILNVPLTTTMRTSRFGLMGFDDYIKAQILLGIEDIRRESLTVIEPTIVSDVGFGSPGGKKWLVTLSKKGPDRKPIRIEADIIVMAAGLRALKRPMMARFSKVTGYQPPEVLPASVTEIDTSKASYNKIGNRMFIIDGIIPNAVLAFIPKGDNWLTLTCLGRKLEKQDLDMIFSQQTIKEFLDLPSASTSPRCHTICGASVFTRPASRFYGDGWVVIGDLAGYSRVLKDGYYGSFLQGWLVARTIAYYGWSKAEFATHYHRRMKYFTGDNRIGMFLFKLNRHLNKTSWFPKLFVHFLRKEASQKGGIYGGPAHAATRALATGELSYKLITALYFVGLSGQAFLQSVKVLRLLLWRRAKLTKKRIVENVEKTVDNNNSYE